MAEGAGGEGPPSPRPRLKLPLPPLVVTDSRVPPLLARAMLDCTFGLTVCTEHFRISLFNHASSWCGLCMCAYLGLQCAQRILLVESVNMFTTMDLRIRIRVEGGGGGG